MKQYFVLFSFISLLTFSCSSNNNTAADANQEDLAAQEEALWDEVIVVHDEVMPKMGVINKTARELKALIDNTPDLSEENKKTIEEAIKNLDDADEGMMSWMSGFKQLEKLRAEMNHEQIITYLNSEMEKISSVKKQMDSSLESGQTLLSTLTSN